MCLCLFSSSKVQQGLLLSIGKREISFAVESGRPRQAEMPCFSLINNTGLGQRQKVAVIFLPFWMHVAGP